MYHSRVRAALFGFVSFFVLVLGAGANAPQGLYWSSRWVGVGVRSMEYGNGWYVGRSYNGLVARSQDGLNWSTAKVGEGVGLRTLGYGDGVWLGVTDNGRWDNSLYVYDVYRSTDDAASWAKVGFVPAYVSLLKVGSVWLALSDRTVYRSSDNGATWMAVETGAQQDLYDLAIGGFGVVVAVGNKGEVVSSSDNGATWTRRNSGSDKVLYSVAYGNGRLVAVGEAGTVLTTTDLFNWQSQASGTTDFLHSVAFGNGVFVHSRGSVSSDGVTWTASQQNFGVSGYDPVYGNAGWMMHSSGSSSVYQTVSGAVSPARDGLAQGTVGQALSYQIQTYGEAATSYLAVNLPPGLSVNTTTGVISGTPTQAGTYQVALYARNANGYGHYAIATFTLANAGANPTPTPTPSPTQTPTPVPSPTPAPTPTPTAVPIDGQRDATFANELPPAILTVNSVARQPDGKVIIGGMFDGFGLGPSRVTRRGLVRLTEAGSLDLTFADQPDSGFRDVFCVAVQADGKVLVGGSSVGLNGTLRAPVMRLNADGSLDTGFQSGLAAFGTVYCLAIQPDGKIIVGGLMQKAGTLLPSILARLNADGSLDTSFGSGGAVDGTKLNGVTRAIALQSNGKILLAGGFTRVLNQPGGSVIRLNSNGSHDASFGTGPNGTPTDKLGLAVALQADGKVLLGGNFQSIDGRASGPLARLNADGSVDTTFQVFDAPSPSSLVQAIAVQANGKILAGGYFVDGTATVLDPLRRLNADGSRDNGFTEDVESNQVYSLVLQPDGKILVGGSFLKVSGISRPGIARLHGSSGPATGGGTDNPTPTPEPGVGKPQKISFRLPPKMVFGGEYILGAKATSKLGIVYEIGGDTAAARVEGNRLTILKASPFTLTARQEGNAQWKDVSVTLDANPARRPQRIAFTPPKKAKAGQTFNLVATVNSPLPVTFESSNPAVLQINGTTAVALAKGKATVTARQDGNENYAPAKPVTKTVAVDSSSSAALLDIATVKVGDAGNAGDYSGDYGYGYGFVGYDFHIGKYEVTTGQYATFLNAVAATNTNSYIVDLWHPGMQSDPNVAGISRSGAGTPASPYYYAVIGSGNRPAAYVSWYNAARFCNWLQNGATSGADTEAGVYALRGATNGSFEKDLDASWWIPSIDEWYKAAYYKSGSLNAGYWSYPTQSNVQPGNSPGGGANSANYNTGVYSTTQSSSYDANQNYLTDAGSFAASPGPYGTFDQGGSLTEWTSSVFSYEDEPNVLFVPIFGGSFADSLSSMLSTEAVLWDYLEPGDRVKTSGFRVARAVDPIRKSPPPPYVGMSKSGQPSLPRYGHTVVWTGSRMIAWGGFVAASEVTASGGAYAPDTDTWASTPAQNSPSARGGHTAVWTGDRMIVWGGADAEGNVLADGHAYYPGNGVWFPISSVNAPSPRCWHAAVWTGTEMIVWGGQASDGSPLGNGAAYNPASNTWRTISDVGAPSPRIGHDAVWAGERMAVWGGAAPDSEEEANGSGAFYDPMANAWSVIPSLNAPPGGRSDRVSGGVRSANVLWTGEKLVAVPLSSAAAVGLYDPRTSAWDRLGNDGAPPVARYMAAWTGSAVFTVGSSGSHSRGATYDFGKKNWTVRVGGATGSFSGRLGVWAPERGEFLVFGGVIANGDASQLYTGGPDGQRGFRVKLAAPRR